MMVSCKAGDTSHAGHFTACSLDLLGCLCAALMALSCVSTDMSFLLVLAVLSAIWQLI